MDYNTLLDVSTDLGYELAMRGAETYRIEDSVRLILQSYGLDAEVFAIPNNLLVSIETPEGKPMTRMRRIGHHGNDLDAIEQFSGLSRAICNRKPEPKEARQWLNYTRDHCTSYGISMTLLGDFLGASGFAVLFGGSWVDCICAGICGMAAGIVTSFLDKHQANQFFRTLIAAFLLSLTAYGFGALGIAPDPDAAIIGALMILVPGLLFINAMRDIIYGDTNSGVNRIVQVFLVAAAIALGGAVAWNVSSALWEVPTSAEPTHYRLIPQCVACFIGCIGFAILFNIHGPALFLTSLGGMQVWAIYLITVDVSGSDLTGYFWGSVFAAVYSEIMARVRKCPAITYLAVSIFPLLPGAGLYYTMTHIVNKEMDLFASRGMYTAAIAGVMAVGILLISTSVRMYLNWKNPRMR